MEGSAAAYLQGFAEQIPDVALRVEGTTEATGTSLLVARDLVHYGCTLIRALRAVRTPPRMRRFPVCALRSVDLGTPDPAGSERFYTDVWDQTVAACDGNAVYLAATGRDHHVLA